MFEVPGSQITGVHVTKEYVMGESSPVYIRNTDVVDNAADEEDMKGALRVKQWNLNTIELIKYEILNAILSKSIMPNFLIIIYI